MTALAALIFLAEAAVTCAPEGSSRLRAGANLVDAIVTIAPQTLETVKPVTAASTEASDVDIGSGDPEAQEPEAIEPDAEQPQADEPEGGEPAEQCAALPLSIA